MDPFFPGVSHNTHCAAVHVLTYDGEGDELVQGGVSGPGDLALVLTRVPGPRVLDDQEEL